MNKELEKRIGDLLMFALHGNADDMSDYMIKQQKETVKLIKQALSTPTSDEIVKELNELRKTNHTHNENLERHWTYNKEAKEFYGYNKELSSWIISASLKFGDIPLELAHKITTFFMRSDK